MVREEKNRKRERKKDSYKIDRNKEQKQNGDDR